MAKVQEALSGVGITSFTGVGIYYDDPAVVSWVDLRSDIWSVISDKDAKKLVSNKEVKVTTLPATTKIVVELPIKNSISYMVGPMIVYPVITKYMQEKWYTTQTPMIELYDMAAKKIYYIADITK